MKCPFFSGKECQFFKNMEDMKQNENKVKLFCTLCIKAAYAQAHLQYSQNFKVVNTL